jgi:hypothetical protein
MTADRQQTEARMRGKWCPWFAMYGDVGERGGKDQMKSLAASAVLMLILAIPATNARADFSQDFEVDTSGWFTIGTNTVNQVPDGYVSPVPYASGIPSASGTHHARLRRGACEVESSGGGDSVLCRGPFTRWGGNNSVWMGGYTTQVDVYLDVAYAIANPDSFAGNIGCLTANSSDTTCKGTRFDFSSAINDSSGNFLQDYAFIVGTGGPAVATPCTAGGFVVAASTNTSRSGTNPYLPGNDPFCVAESGWYTFKHTFMDVGGVLEVRMEIFPLGSGTPLHDWTIRPGHAIADVGCNRYGFFVDQEIWDLAIDNSIMVGCGTPSPTTTTTTTTTSSTLASTTTTTVVVPSTTTTLPPSTTSTTTTSSPSTSSSTTLPPERCGNCVDDDGNGLIDFEDPACCSGAAAFMGTLRQGRMAPRGGQSFLRLRATLATAGFGVTPPSDDVFLQIRQVNGPELLCALVPAGKFMKMGKGYKFWDKRTVPSAQGIDDMFVQLSPNGHVPYRTYGRRVNFPTPPAGDLEITVGFRDPAVGDASNQCSRMTVPFRAGKNGARRYP